jgi:hypothetical protein
MKTQGQIVANTVKSLHVQRVIANKGWSEQHAALVILDFITCGQKVSLFDFLEAQDSSAYDL